MPVGEVALALGCLLDKVFGGFGRFWRAPGGFGGFWRVWRVWRVLEGGPTGQVPHLRWSQAPPRPWRRPGSADSMCELAYRSVHRVEGVVKKQTHTHTQLTHTQWQAWHLCGRRGTWRHVAALCVAGVAL